MWRPTFGANFCKLDVDDNLPLTKSWILRWLAKKSPLLIPAVFFTASSTANWKSAWGELKNNGRSSTSVRKVIRCPAAYKVNTAPCLCQDFLMKSRGAFPKSIAHPSQGIQPLISGGYLVFFEERKWSDNSAITGKITKSKAVPRVCGAWGSSSILD